MSLNIAERLVRLIGKGERRLILPQLDIRGRFEIEHWRGDKLLRKFGVDNGITVEGKNHLLDVTFGNSSPVTQVTPWYIGLINNSPTPTLSENDTLASHAGWSEFSSYSGNRKAWDDANASAKVKGTTAASEFTMTGTGTIYGVFVCAAASGTTGVLWSTAAFDATAAVVSSDVLRISYGIRT